MNEWKHILISNVPTSALFVEIKDGSTVFPLYYYLETNNQNENKNRKPNLNEKIVAEIAQRLQLQFVGADLCVCPNDPISNEMGEHAGSPAKFTPIDLFDYIYAVLHSPAYREKYREFLKIDFPRVPYPENTNRFWALAALGGKLRRLHLLEGVEPQPGMADYPVAGSNEVEKALYMDEKVYINKTQYFAHVPPEAWNFYIGGYQPAQKWLKDRKGRHLQDDDIHHYQRIIRVLKETGKVMQEIDEVCLKK